MEVPDILNFKIIVLGFQGTGKSSLVARYIKGMFLEHYNVTVGVGYSTKIMALGPGHQIKIQIWDIVIDAQPQAGQQFFRSLVKSFYKGISAVFFVYSVDSRQSFEYLKSWSDEVKEYAHEEVTLFLIAAKSDIQDRRQVRPEAAQNFLKQMGGAYFVETSAKLHQKSIIFSKKLRKCYSANYQFKRFVSPGELWSNNQTRERGDSLILRRQTIQKELTNTRKKNVLNDHQNAFSFHSLFILFSFIGQMIRY